MSLWVGVFYGKWLPTTFSGDRHGSSRDIMVLVCHVISQDHMIKRLCDVKGTLRAGVYQDKLPSCQVWWPYALCAEI